MPSSFMPDVEVHIAFNAGYTTPAASRTWTDVSSYVELHEKIGIDFGRQDERSTADANQLTLTLDNRDGRFTALRSASPYFPNVKVGRPIRVRVTPPGGSTVTRFVGFVDEWPVEWDGSDAYAKASIRASSRMARLGLSATLRSMPEAEILSASPVRYWTLGDPSDAISAAESSGQGGGPLGRRDIGVTSAPVVFGQAIGPYTDGMTAAQFGTGPNQYLGGDLSVSAGARSVRATVLVNAIPIGFANVASVGSVGIFVDSAGLVRGPNTTGPSINDGATHDVCVVNNGSAETLYLDGVAVASAAATSPGAADQAIVGSYMLQAVISHVALYDYALSVGQAASQAQAILNGFTGDRTSVRLTRILGWVGVAATEVTADIGAGLMTYQLTAGSSVMEALRECESTEGGVLFDGADGNVVFHNRNRRYTKPAAATLNMASQHVGSDYAPRLDRTALTNDVTVENPTTGESSRSMDATSQSEYGIAATSMTSVSYYTDEPLPQKASWLIAAYANPRIRVPSLTVDVVAHQGLTPSAQTLLGVTVGDRLDVTNAPTQADTSSPSYFVEGYTESIGPESYEITFNLSPSYPALNTFVLDDAARGQLDAGNLLAL